MPATSPGETWMVDLPRVRRLAERLKAADVRGWLDEWIVKAGDLIALKVDEGLEQSRALLPVLPSQLSTFNSQPPRTGVHRDPANAGRRFIPLLLGECALSDTLRRYKYVDFREKSDATFAEVLATLRGTLLPKLLSGELSVSEVEKEVSA